MSAITQVRLSGFGGQGIVLAGVLLGQAGVLDGKFVTGTNSYGAQARGSGCKAEVVFSDQPIDFPQVIVADILVAMSQGGYRQYASGVREPSGLILYDQGQVHSEAGLEVRQIGIPATEWAIKKLKAQQAANIVMLGALTEITRLVSVQAMQKAIRLLVADRFRRLNLAALKTGTQLGRQPRG